MRYPGDSPEERALGVIRSALTALIASGGIGHDGRVPPFAMASAGVQAGISSGELGYALGELVAAGALRLESGRGYYLRSRGALTAGDRP